jgi:hypothetical protein
LVTAGLIFGSYPLLIGLAWDATLYWVACLVGGVIWAVISVSLLNRVME